MKFFILVTMPFRALFAANVLLLACFIMPNRLKEVYRDMKDIVLTGW